MKNNNRRDFIKKSLLGISGTAILPKTIKNYCNSINPDAPELPSRKLGKTGLKIPMISLGASGASEPAFVKAAYNAGIKLFFSATYYGEGNNEKLVGDGLKGLPRDSFIVGTAVSASEHDNRSGLFKTPLDINEYIRKAEISLSRFGLDHVDILLFPYASKRATILDDNLLKAMEQLKKQGKTRFAGIASHSNMDEALRAAADSGVYDVAMITYNFKVNTQESLNTAIDYAAGKGLGVVAMKTTAGAFNNKSGPALNTDAAFKWVLKNENITSIVSGMTTIEQMQKNLAMLGNLRLSEQELKELGLAAAPHEYGLFCQQCGQCTGQCPYNLDIPAIMRSYMYAYGYRNMEQAWHTLAEAAFTSSPCDNCDKCTVKCSAGFNVKNKISDIARLKEVPEEFILSHTT